VDIDLWSRQPAVMRFRPAYPGAQLATATFLSDGTIELIDALQDHPSGGLITSLRETWLIDPASGSGHSGNFGPVGPRSAAVAVSPDGRRVATLQDASRIRSTGQSASLSPGRLDGVWVTGTSTGADPGSAVYQLESSTQTPIGSIPREQLAGVSWLPDSRHVLVSTQLGDLATGAAVRTRLLIVDAGPDGGEQLDSQPVELIVVPAEVLMDSVVWSPDGRHAAVLLRAPAAPGAKRLVGLAIVNVNQAGETPLVYVADVGPDDTLAGRLPVAPVAWESCGPDYGCVGGQHLAYTALVTNATSTATSPLNLLGLTSTPSSTPGGLFVTMPGSATFGLGDAPRLGSATGVIGPAWRSLGSTAQNAALIGFAQNAAHALALRAFDPVTGSVQDLGVQLPAEVAAGSRAVGVRWDPLHARALVLARSPGQTAAAADGIDVWLVDFSPASAEVR